MEIFEDIVPSESLIMYYDFGKCDCGKPIEFNSYRNIEVCIRYEKTGKWKCSGCGMDHQITENETFRLLGERYSYA